MTDHDPAAEAADAARPSQPWRILVVCTGNICRSPIVERLFQSRLTDAGHHVVVRSAGTYGGRLRPDDPTTRAAATIGVDLGDHVSRQLDAHLIGNDGADLVVTMTREHLREVVGIEPSAWPRTFTLRELARRGLDADPDIADLASWTSAVGAGRKAASMLEPSPDDDVRDPYGGPYRDHVEMVEQVDALVDRVVRLLPRP